MSKKSDKKERDLDESQNDDEHRERKKHKHKHKHKSESRERDKSLKTDESPKKKIKTDQNEEKKEADTSKDKMLPTEEIESKEKESNDSENLMRKKVHSANNWEGVDLGDQNRKLKFLKLMGAFKNPDKNVPPSKQRKPTIQSEKLNQDLEKQFNEGLSNKHNRQVGLGFSQSSNPSTSSSTSKTEQIPPTNTHVTFDD